MGTGLPALMRQKFAFKEPVAAVRTPLLPNDGIAGRQEWVRVTGHSAAPHHVDHKGVVVSLRVLVIQQVYQAIGSGKPAGYLLEQLLGFSPILAPVVRVSGHMQIVRPVAGFYQGKGRLASDASDQRQYRSHGTNDSVFAFAIRGKS
jgi:hypothetical protein